MKERSGEEAVEAAGRRVFEQGWLHDDALFSPGRPVWTPGHVEELYEHFVSKPDTSGETFMNKFERQLRPVSDEAKQLAAELLYLNLLPLSDYFGNTKRKVINTVLGWRQAPVAIPPDLGATLDRGAFNGGVAFKTRRPFQLVLLVRLVQQFKALDESERQSLLADPWAFRDFIRSADGPKEPVQRNSLLYLAFPEYFAPIVSTDHRARLVKAFAEYLDTPTGDIDRDLHAIQSAANREANGYADFYVSPWRERWMPSREPAVEEVELVPEARRAWLVRGSSVRGSDLVPAWVSEGFVSLAASQLPDVPADISRDGLKLLVDEHYSHVSYSQREQKLDEFSAFLFKMSPGDIVATTSQGRLRLGRITAEATFVASPDGRSNLRRSVAWEGAERSVEYEHLPALLSARLQSQHDVIDLTPQLDELERLLEATGLPSAPAPSLKLPDATDALAEQLLVDKEWLQECVDLLRDKPQLIFYGPPGTGKTYLAQHLAWHLAGRENSVLVQFHPAYSYEDFFEGYRPKTGAGGALAFELQSGPFRRIVDQARENPESPYVLIIDEINRGNLAKIFGELYFLLEYRNEAIELLYSSGDKQAFTLPANVFLLGTMNTADRSIALVDAAMRRRFSFVGLRPEEEPTRSMLHKWLATHGLPDTAARLLERLNSLTDDPEFRVGPSYFMRPAAHENGGLERVWRTAIEPLLEEHHYGEGVDVGSRYGLEKLVRVVQGETASSDEPEDDTAAVPDLA